MKRLFVSWLIAAGVSVLAPSASAASVLDLLVGTYTGTGSKGIYRDVLDSATGQIDASPQQVAISETPSSLIINAGQK